MCPLFSEICIRSWNAFKGNSPWNRGPLWRKMAFTLSREEASSWAPSLDTLEQGVPLWGWLPRPQPLRNIKERPMVYLGASMYFFWSSVYVVGGWGWGWSDGVYMIEGTSFLIFHPGNLYWPPTLSFFSWILPAYILLFVCFCFLFFSFWLWPIMFSGQYYQWLNLTFTLVAVISQSLVQKQKQPLLPGVPLMPY